MKKEWICGVLYAFKCLKCGKVVAWPSALEKGICVDCRLLIEKGQTTLMEFIKNDS